MFIFKEICLYLYYKFVSTLTSKIMSNWQTKQGKDELIEELKNIEKTFLVANLKWAKIKRQKEDNLSITVDIIKRQVRNGFIQLKPEFDITDELYKSISNT